MVPIPQDPQARARVKATILARVTEFMVAHKGHDVSHSRTASENEPWLLACDTCHERITIVFKYEEKTH
jgi:hypothetical protein